MPSLTLNPWSEAGFAVLETMNAPDQMAHLGGPETPEKLRDRHRRYLTYHQHGECEMLLIALDGTPVGSIGYWEITRNGTEAYETGWGILPIHQGRGLGAQAANLLIERLKPIARHPHLFAFPTPDNRGSNGICRRAGFELLGVEDFEYPKGVVSPHNVWRLDISKH